MTNVDMIIAIAMGDIISIWDTWSLSNGKPDNDTAQGGLTNVFYSNQTKVSSGIYVSMKRLLDTGDKFDFAIDIGQTVPFTYAYLDGMNAGFHRHSYEGTGTIKVGYTQKSSNVNISGGAAYADNFKTHGIMMGHVWMGVMLLGVIAARYFKFYWPWYWVHMAAGLYTLVITIIYGMYAYDKDKPGWDGTINQWLYHNRCGFFILSLVPAQVMLGFVSRYWTWKGRSLQALSTFRRMHYILGWTLMAVSLAAVYYGLQCFHSSDLDNLEWAFTLFCLILIGFETWHQVMGYWNPRKSIPNLEHISWAEVYRQVKSGKKYVFLDTHVLDVSSFIDSHPGGSYLLSETIGEDYGKYIYGVNGFHPGHTGFLHPNIVWTNVSMMKIGETGYHEGVILMNSGPPELHNMQWTLASKTPLAPNVSRFAFVSDELFVNGNPEGLDWMGTHFRVTIATGAFSMNKVNRYYSLCLFFNQENMMKWVESAQREGLQVSLAAGRRPSIALPTLDLVVKVYPPYGQMSTFIHNMEPGDPITVTGPLGPGLILTPALSGHFCAFGAGTGVLPFIDLIEFLWWKELCDRGDVKDQRYGGLNGFSMTLYASFNKEEDIIAGDLMRCTHALCHQSGQATPRFQLVLVVNATFQGKLDDVAFGVLSSKPTKRVWTCGPTGFNRWISKLATEAGIKRSNILVM